MRHLFLSRTYLHFFFALGLVFVLYNSISSREIEDETWNEEPEFQEADDSQIISNIIIGEDDEGSGFSVSDEDDLYADYEREPIYFATEDKKFLFHNKVPKSGSSTMKYILKVLSKRNDFYFQHYRVHKCPIGNTKKLLAHTANLRKKHKRRNIALLKHHTWLNFTAHGYPQPQFINVLRNPVTQFKSHYYFSRYGWGLMKGKRKTFKGERDDRKRSIDDCVAEGHDECVNLSGVLNKYFCNDDPVCEEYRTHQKIDGEWQIYVDEEKMQKATEISKQTILKYRQIGLLEEFEKTLELLEKTIPEFYDGAREAYYGDYVQKFVRLTRSKSSGNMTEETGKKLEQLLKYDMDIYNLAKQVFHHRLKENGIESDSF